MYRQNFPDDPGMHNAPGDVYTNVRYRDKPSCCQRIKNSVIAIFAGCALLSVAIGVLFWNEGRAVQTARSLDEGLGIIIRLPNADAVNEYNYGKLIHVSGELRTGKVLSDPEYGIALPVVRLRRNVEMYQWVENERKRKIKEGDRSREETTYDYSMEWRKEVVNSASFANSVNYRNPTELPVNQKEYKAGDTQVGAFYLSENLIAKVADWKKLSLTSFPVTDQNMKVHAEYFFYHGNNPLYPAVGDARVSFEYAGVAGKSQVLGDVDTASVIAKQLHGQLVAYQTDAGDGLELLYMGRHSAEKIFGNEHAQNTMLTWGLRLGGWLLMFIAFTCMTQILNTLVDWLPVVRTIVAMGTIALNTSLSISLSLVVIALGWIRYRPWLGLSLLACASAPFILAKVKQRTRTRLD